MTQQVAVPFDRMLSLCQVAVKVTLLNFMITQVDGPSTWASWHLLVLIHVWFILTDWCKGKSLPETMVFPWNIGVSGSNFALNQSIDWSPHLGVPAMLQKKVYPGLQMGEVGLCRQLKFASSIFQKSMSIPFSTCSRYLDDGFGSSLVKVCR